MMQAQIAELLPDVEIAGVGVVDVVGDIAPELAVDDDVLIEEALAAAAAVANSFSAVTSSQCSTAWKNGVSAVTRLAWVGYIVGI
jgi:hypothetical protein